MAQRHLAVEWCDGLALYINPLERDLVDLLDAANFRRPRALSGSVPSPRSGSCCAQERTTTSRSGCAGPHGECVAEGLAGRRVPPLRLGPPGRDDNHRIDNSPIQARAALAAVQKGVNDIDRFRFIASD
jgi:hypothetical protein